MRKRVLEQLSWSMRQAGVQRSLLWSLLDLYLSQVATDWEYVTRQARQPDAPCAGRRLHDRLWSRKALGSLIPGSQQA